MQQFGRYIIRKQLGEGGMAKVYLAYDPNFQRDVALKVLPRQFTKDPQFTARFRTEATVIAKLEHSAIVPVYDFGEHNGQPYIVMRYMSGGALEDRLRTGRLRPKHAFHVLQRVCSALDKAHKNKVVHRDLKPANILFDEDSNAYLADFGIARMTEGTQTMTIIGTPQYMAPEQAKGERLDGRTDVYQMGCVLFEMLTGHIPYKADTHPAILYKHTHAPIPSVRTFDGSLSPAYDIVIKNALAKERTNRYATAGALAQAFHSALSGHTVRTITKSKPPFALWIGAGLAIVALLLFLVFGQGNMRAETEVDTTQTQSIASVITIVATPTPTTQSPNPTSTVATANITRDPDAPATQKPTETLASSATPLPTATAVQLYPQQLSLGRASDNTEIVAYQFGDGPTSAIFIGGFHSGFAPGSVTLANLAVEWLEQNPNIWPQDTAVYIVPNANPSTPYDPGDVRGRINANGVELNRNWDCDWRRDSRFGSTPVSGGSAPFSEPETQALKSLIEDTNAEAVVVWSARAKNGLVAPGVCGNQILVSQALATTYGLAAGYEVAEFEGGYTVNGDITNWLDSQRIPAIYILSKSHTDADWSNNLRGLQAVLRSLD